MLEGLMHLIAVEKRPEGSKFGIGRLGRLLQ